MGISSVPLQRRSCADLSQWVWQTLFVCAFRRVFWIRLGRQDDSQQHMQCWFLVLNTRCAESLIIQISVPELSQEFETAIILIGLIWNALVPDSVILSVVWEHELLNSEHNNDTGIFKLIQYIRKQDRLHYMAVDFSSKQKKRHRDRFNLCGCPNIEWDKMPLKDIGPYEKSDDRDIWFNKRLRQ